MTASSRNQTMQSLYADHALTWNDRTRMYRRFVGSYAVFFTIVGIMNIGTATEISVLYASIQAALVLMFAVLALAKRPVGRLIGLGAVFVLAISVQVANPLDQFHGMVAAASTVAMMGYLGGFRTRPALKILALGCVLVAVLVMSTMQYLLTPDVDGPDVWTTVAHLSVWGLFVYHVVLLWVKPLLAERGARIRDQIKADLAIGLMRGAQEHHDGTIADKLQHEAPLQSSAMDRPAPRQANTITSHLDQIDAMATEDLPFDRAQCYLAHTNAVRNKLAHFVRKYIIEPVSTSAYRSRR